MPVVEIPILTARLSLILSTNVNKIKFEKNKAESH